MSQVYDELAGLAADIHTWLDWARLTGSEVLPRERVEPLHAAPLQRTTAPKPAPTPKAAPVRPAPPSPPTTVSKKASERTPPAQDAVVPAAGGGQTRASAKWAALMTGPTTHSSQGPPDAALLVIRGSGSSPEAEEMLDRMLENVLGTDRSAIVIIDLIRDTRGPAQIGAGVLAALSAHQPKAILVMGTFAARAMFSDDDSVASIRGDWRPIVWPGGQADARVTHHPEAILALAARGEHAPKRETFADLKAVGERLSRS